jgi:N-acetylmuramoyl-L-alanine amidase
MDYSQYNNEQLLAIVAYREARGEGADGMRAVMHVILNRSKAWNKTVYQVIFAPNQFTSMSLSSDPNYTLIPADTELVWKLAADITDGDDVDPTFGALYYYNPATATSGWFVRNIVNLPEKHPLTATIGHQYFYA